MINEYNLQGFSDGIEKTALIEHLFKAVPKFFNRLASRSTVTAARESGKAALIGTALTVPVVGTIGLHQMTGGMPKAEPLTENQMAGY